MRSDERELFEPWLEAFSRNLDVSPIVEPFHPDVPGAPDDLFTITFPVAFEPKEILGGTGHFRAAPAVVAQMHRLGFRWDDDGRIRTAPTPSTFNALLPLVGRGDAGFRAVFTREDRETVDLGPWLDRYLRGELPIHVASRGFYAPSVAAGGRAPHGMRWHLTSLAHDLTVHVQNYHMVPHAAIAALRARVIEGAGERLAGFEQPGRTAPLTLTFFLDNDLNRFCYGVWCRCRTPEEFSGIFDAHFDQLLAVLDTRLDETRRGLGDVKSGRSEEMRPLAHAEFTIR